MQKAIILLLVFLCLNAKAQNEEESEITMSGDPKVYEIGNIKVIGAVFADDAAIISVCGLKGGQRITIPSEYINKAM